jgi:hypothetical protein
MEGVGALTRAGPGFLHPRERERRALSRCRRRRSDLEGGGVETCGLEGCVRDRGLSAASRRAAWGRRPGSRPVGGVRVRGLEGGGVRVRGLEGGGVETCGLVAAASRRAAWRRRPGTDAGGVCDRRGRRR